MEDRLTGMAHTSWTFGQGAQRVTCAFVAGDSSPSMRAEPDFVLVVKLQGQRILETHCETFDHALSRSLEEFNALVETEGLASE